MPAKRANQMSSCLTTLHCHITGHFANDRILLSVGFTVSKRSHTTVTYRCIVRTTPVYVLAHWWLVAPGTIARLAQSHVLKTSSSQSCTFTPVVDSKVCVVDTLLPLFWMNAPFLRRKNDKWCRGTFTFSGIWHLASGTCHVVRFTHLPCPAAPHPSYYNWLRCHEIGENLSAWWLAADYSAGNNRISESTHTS